MCSLSRGHRAEFLENSQAILLVLLPAHPEVVPVLHHVGQHGAADENHVFSARRVLNAVKFKDLVLDSKYVLNSS